tara:strand:- start:283 stop:414 length:132 start_codon:yes stop_codon:yes gene_type:complete
MRHILNKYDDVAETLKSILLAIVVATTILGLAPMIMILQAQSF